MSTDSARQVLEEKIGKRFGRNKTEEIRRLLVEIARRESESADSVLIQSLTELERARQNLSFAHLKKILLRRRFPSFDDRDLNRVYFAPLPPKNDSKSAVPHPGNEAEFEPVEIFIEKKARDYPLTKRATAMWPHVPVYEIGNVKELRRPKREWVSDFGKRRLTITFEHFDLAKPCPCSAKTLSCRYYLLNLGYGCPYDCSYCFLQSYQNLPAIVLPANVENFLESFRVRLRSNTISFARIGTGEFTDSLALDRVTEYSKVLVPFFADQNITLELKTKSDCVENLFGLSHGGKTVIAWSVNPDRWCAEEKGAPSLARRLEAAARCEKEGYGTAFHLDPILALGDWETEYRALVQSIFSRAHKSVRWVSLGTLRFHKILRGAAEERHPESEIFLGEMRLDPVDGKVRYADSFRVDIYRKVVRWIREHHETVPIYLCMEPVSIWKAVFGELPFQKRIDAWIASEGACGR